jgi:putative ATPase
MDLFTQQTGHEHQPLAYRMRPRTLDEYVGQDHIVGTGRLLRRAIQADQLSSIILYGPPGTGKTTLARVIANTTKSHFSTLNAVLSGVKELRYEIEEAKNRLAHYQKRTILFVDEVHRWNKSQQDALLPWVENGTCILVGATTENPYFEVNSALVSRSRIFQLLPLGPTELFQIAHQAMQDRERGYGMWSVELEPGALEHLVDIANGDARSLLNALELAVETSGDRFPPVEGSTITISKEAAEESIQRKVVLYDKEGDYHFDIISAFIKSIRGSDPDAALYWMARMVRAGEDPKFIFRRMLISACEDIGMADPQAIMVVEADAAAFERIGLPEGRFHLTHAALYLATAPKSNTTMAFFDALKAIEEEQNIDVPNHLKDGNRDKKGFGHGEGYLYPHAYHNHWVPQQYLPGALQGKVFYHPSHMGYEEKIRDEVLKRRESQLESVVPDTHAGNLTYSPDDSMREQWAQRTIGDRGILLSRMRDSVFNLLDIRRHDRVLVLNAGHGLFVWEAFRRVPEGLVVAQSSDNAHVSHMQHYAKTLDSLERPQLHCKTIAELLERLDPELQFEHIVGRNIFTRLQQQRDLVHPILQRLSEHGTFITAETIPSLGSRLSHFAQEDETISALESAEAHLYGAMGNSATSWGFDELLEIFPRVGYEITTSELPGTEQRMLHHEALRRWIAQSYIPAWEANGETWDAEQVVRRITQTLENREVTWKQTIAVITVRKRSGTTD